MQRRSRTPTLALLMLLSATAPGFAQRAVVVARPAQSSLLDTQVSLDVHDVRVGAALVKLNEVSGVPISFSPTMLPRRPHVSCACRGVTLRTALNRLLSGSGFGYLEMTGQIVIVKESPARPVSRLALGTIARFAPRNGRTLIRQLAETVTAPAERAEPTGSIAGRVTDAATGAGVPAANVLLHSARLGTTTDAEGRYRLMDVPAGNHTLVVERIGYERVSCEVRVADGAQAAIDFALGVVAAPLEEIVVTGNLVETRLRELSHPVTVLTEAEIERKQITRVGDLLRGSVPGVILVHQGSGNEGYAPIFVRGSSGRVSSIKTYVDGVEVTDYGMAATTIDPNMIERVEVIRGPQASTLYGSDAVAGVLQIFTKKGANLGLDRPRITAKTSMGVIESEFKQDDFPLLQEHSVNLSGGGPSFSYSLGGMYLSKGEWYREFFTDEHSFSGAIRASHGPFSAEVSARQYTRNTIAGISPRMRIWFPDVFNADNDLPVNQRQMTAGVSLGYLVGDRWQQNLLIGFDQSEFEYHNTKPKYRTPADTTLTVVSIPGNRTSYRYTSSLNVPLSPDLSSTLVAGIDHWRYQEASFSTLTAVRNEGLLDQSDARITRVSYGNTGYFAQWNWAFRDRLFLNTGLRAENNDNFGDDYGLAWAHRIGATYVHDLPSGLHLKARVSFGSAIRPPQPNDRQSYATSTSIQLANLGLGPEEQVGWDGGVDLLFGDRFRLSITRYDQEVRNMITRVDVEPTAGAPTNQVQNVGRVANNGWELEGGLEIDPFRLDFTFTTMNSKVRELAPNYTGDLEVGDQSLLVPEHSGGATLTYSFLRGAVSLEAAYIGELINTDYEAQGRFVYGGEAYRGSGRAYWMKYDPITKLNLRVDQAITDQIDVFGRIDNLTDDQSGEGYNFSAYPGRTTVLGLRWTH